ncbi:hypothetical protein B0A67_00350 [Flavobacterium aquidurense]|uniref:hypothetical protein n=1 Tax=Flavobacterium aquidurense TaxID=362413 RepID=UPI00091061F1|nr:hypothetical protein [Flavobacterium aquidurense]OXA74274.1 hypothetical protein B0A67_00350 [Flavobacterium aquidurense]SHF91220.1 hypothetical protein SAMN05444481_10171 [Flavobacterium frigidimaris]
MSNLINWEHLKPYEDDKKKSFEELCYQIVFELYSSKARLNSIDDSGGGDGVEFYLEFANGDIWGWQCKFFGRFSESGRQEQIKKSLQKAADVHGSRLKKWFLCSKLSMTPSEKLWFDSCGELKYKGKPVLSSLCNPELIHWGDSEILNYLRKYPNVQRYFFADKILDYDWFKEKFDIVRESRVIKSKYLEKLHINGSADEEISRFIGGNSLAELILDRAAHLDIDRFKIDYEDDIKKIRGYDVSTGFEKTVKKISKFVLVDSHVTLIERGNVLLRAAVIILQEKERYELNSLLKEIDNFVQEFQVYYNEYSILSRDEAVADISWDAERKESDHSIKQKIRDCRNCLLGPYFTIRNFDAYINIFAMLQSVNETETYISGNASKGKTHLAVDTVRKQIDGGKPALFLFGSQFRSNLPVKEQMKQLLDIPSDWNVKDFFGALEICARVHKTKLVLAIDGLNESAYWKDIWVSGIEELANEIRLNFSNILLIATYRSSYEEVLFPKGYLSYPDGKWSLKVEVDGFTNYNVNEATERYFDHYGITLQNNSDRISHFTEPLYLTIFCEAKKGETVSFQNEDMFDIFEEYLQKCNENIVGRLGREFRYSKSFTKDILNKISDVLWNSDKRDVPLQDVVPAVLDTETLHAFEGEDLLIFRDWDGKEVVAFTYDLLNGYLIAKSILETVKDGIEVKALIKSEKFAISLLGENRKHALYDDILRSFCILAIKRFGLESLISESYSLSKYTVEALFDLNADIILPYETLAKKMVATAFQDTSRTWSLIDLFDTTELVIEHPLNFLFLSDLLRSMNVAFRDIYWTEKCRGSYYPEEEGNYYSYINHIEKSIREKEVISDRVHIAARKLMWMLTVTNRDMRDHATRALYYYGRRFPMEFTELVSYSLAVNDPYVWERTLGAMYGVILAEHNNMDRKFKEQHLKPVGQMLYSLIFSEDAPHGTTHYLARSYAAMSIETALKYFPDLLNESEQNNMRAPYKTGGIRDWGEFDYEKQKGNFNDPIYMDFSNYTIGQIVDDGRNYDDPDSKKKVRRQIYWRIFQLGWDGLIFKEMDSRIQRMEHTSRGTRAKIERYGKKYSWIAFYELAGLRDDEGLLKNEYGDFRIINPDIDLSFPEDLKDDESKFVDTDYLGDRNRSLMEWYRSGGGADVTKYLEVKGLNGEPGEWICMDGFISQEDKEIQRERFIFIRALIIKNKDLDDALLRLDKQNFRGRWLPEKRENHDCFAGEMYLFDGAVYGNYVDLSFIEDTKTYTVKKDHPDYNPQFNFDTFEMEYPEEIEVTKQIKKKFEILLPVMEYAFSSDSSANSSGHRTVISKELFKKLELVNEPDTFNLKDSNNRLASQEINYNKDYNNKYNLVYIRKDLLDNFLNSKNCTLVWGIWGERNFSLGNINNMRDLHAESGLKNFPVFQSLEIYRE